MAKNILIFADGTGQAGGLRPDQLLSNIYKLYRATRSGPDSPIDPAEQIAFYDPGLGTTTDAGLVKLRFVDRLRALAGSIAGIGISANVTDCYEFILKHYQPGDRIYLFGFSRGAYTARSVAGVLNLCGVPTQDRSGSPLPRAGRRLRAIAAEAVTRVYDHGAGKPRALYEEQREELARRFRHKYASGDEHTATVHPYFIGLFDAVAALGLPKRVRIPLAAAFVVASAVVAWIGALFLHWLVSLNVETTFWMLIAALSAGFGVQYLRATFKWIRNFPARRGVWRWHLARWQGKEYDRFLDKRVSVVRHALAIDETRTSFERVKWGVIGDQPTRSAGELERFEQVWFAGNHSDIGGSYPEDESRLSDIALNWLLGEATDALHPICVDHTKLHLYPAADGPQHCQVEMLRDGYPNWWPQALRKSWPSKPRAIHAEAVLHPSVLRRFELGSVIQHGILRTYRPTSLRNHRHLQQYYTDQ